MPENSSNCRIAGPIAVASYPDLLHRRDAFDLTGITLGGGYSGRRRPCCCGSDDARMSDDQSVPVALDSAFVPAVTACSGGVGKGTACR